jgi:alpha-L-fucosidase
MKAMERKRFVCASCVLLLSGGLTTSAHAQSDGLSYQQGKFKPTDESLKQYQYPEWFRDAKFGIWAHWGPQAVPRHGDWYARNMYIQGDGDDYNDHLKRYGHPSVAGYKDIIPLWKAEKWDPEALMKLYKRVGAQIFCVYGKSS